jgi:preprotein translocase subunit SecD
MRIGLAAGLLALMAVSGPATAAERPDIEIHAVADCADSVAPPQRDPLSHQDVCVAPTMIVGGPDVTRVREVAGRNGDDVLQVELSEKASYILLHYTLSRVEKKIAVLIDGKLVYAPILEQPLISRRFEVPALSKGEITAIVERFKASPPI